MLVQGVDFFCLCVINENSYFQKLNFFSSRLIICIDFVKHTQTINPHNVKKSRIV